MGRKYFVFLIFFGAVIAVVLLFMMQKQALIDQEIKKGRVQGQTEKSCDIPPSSRTRCGWSSLLNWCKAAGCCWRLTEKRICHRPSSSCWDASKQMSCEVDRESICKSHGCCWDESDPHGKPCYLPRGKSKIHSNNTDRYNCGWPGIDEKTCLKRGCDWVVSDPIESFCFFKPEIKSLPEGFCPAAPYDRKKCGSDDITKEECLREYCCWDDTLPDTTWCFHEPVLEENQEDCSSGYLDEYANCVYVCDTGKVQGIYCGGGLKCCLNHW